MTILRMLVLAHLSIEAREFYSAASLLFQAKGALHAWRDQTPEVRREKPSILNDKQSPVGHLIEI
jgi:hypothetical protein